MGEIKDFKCTYVNSAGITEEVTKKLNLKFPDAYLYHDTMVELSIALKEHDQAVFCEMPFCHTVEGEAMGGSITYGDEKTGPRAKEYVCNSLEEVLELPEIDFSKGRIKEVLVACQQLKEKGEHVVLEISGPFTILNILIDTKHVFRALRKNPELLQQVFDKIGAELLRYVREAKKYGVEFISYADSSASVGILGPKVMEQFTHMFTYGFLKELEKETDENCMILLCPKTTFALLGTEKAVFEDVELDEVMRYSEACIFMLGKTSFAGQMCVKNVGHTLESKKFKKVVLV